MKRTLLIATMIVAACAAAPAQGDSRTRARAEGQGSASLKQGDQLELAAGTRLAAQLQQTLDVRKARVGDEVVLKTTEAIKSNGQTVVKRGARLVGRVTEVRQRAAGETSSRIGLVFDRLESGSLVAPISVTVAAVTQTSARAGGGDDFGADAGGSASAAGGSSQGGGLIGGVGSTVGGVVGTTTGAVGQTVGTAAGAAGGVAGGAGRAVRGLRIEQAAGAELSGSSTLSLAGGNLRLEKNTTFHLVVQESAGVNR